MSKLNLISHLWGRDLLTGFIFYLTMATVVPSSSIVSFIDLCDGLLSFTSRIMFDELMLPWGCPNNSIWISAKIINKYWTKQRWIGSIKEKSNHLYFRYIHIISEPRVLG